MPHLIRALRYTGKIGRITDEIRRGAKRLGRKRRNQLGRAGAKADNGKAPGHSGFRKPGTSTMPSFVIAGGAELRGGSGTYPERIVRYKDHSPDAMKEKVRFTVGSMEERLGEFGYGWKDTTAVQAYTVHDFHPVMVDELVRRGAARSGLTWHFARPPVVDLEFEMDCRRVARETVI